MTEQTTVPDRFVIRIMPGNLSLATNEAGDVLIAMGVPFYERGDMLVRPIVKTVDSFHGHKTNIAQFTRVTDVYARDKLGQIASWQKYDGRSRAWTLIDPPHDVAATLLARVGEWRFPTVAGVINAPTMRPDGTILDQPGYDPETRLLLVKPPTMPPIPENPTRNDAIAALALLEDLLKEFLFVNEVAKAVGLSALITPVVRGALAQVPMHAVDAPRPDSGKSYWLDTVSAIATGQPMPVISAGRTEEETEKRLGGAVLAGQPLITIDNMTVELRGDALCQIIERPRPFIRILGKSDLVPVESRLTTFANGNNLVITVDMCRRVVCARLDPKMEKPETRVFEGDPVATVLADRGKYIAAALTVCRAYIVAKRPKLAKPLHSFEAWSNTVRSALIWLGKADPVTSIDASNAQDPAQGKCLASVMSIALLAPK